MSTSAQDDAEVTPAGQPEALQRQFCEWCRAERVHSWRKDQRYCSDKCRFAAWDKAHPRQLTLPAEPPVALVQRIGPTPEQIRRCAKPQTVKVLRMLQEAGVMGCTTGDFLRAGIGRFGARIGELRQVGHVISMDRLTDSSALYVLEEP